MSLEHNSLEGAIPPELGNLTELTWMRLDSNELEGPIPSQLGRLNKLDWLNLGWNNLTGPIPPELGNLASLSSLSLNVNELTGPIPLELGNLSTLRSLSLGNNGLTGPIPPWLATLTQLDNISLHRNALTGPIPPELGSLNLYGLWLSDNQLTGPIPPELGNLNLLEVLLLGSNRLSGPVPPELGNLHRLVQITLGDNLLTGSIPQTFLGLTNLATLSCRRTEYGVCLPGTDAFREWAKEVEARGSIERAVDIPWCNEIDKGALKTLYEATNGSAWTHSGGWLEDENLGRWHGVRTDSDGRVTGLDLSGNGLSGIIPQVLGRLANLRELRIGDNDLAGRLPLSLAEVPLEALDYRSTSLCVPDDAGFRAWLAGIPRHSGTGAECGPLTEREVLEGLYWNTEGPSWSESGGWLTDAPLAEWEGVETDAAGRVVVLRLGARGLSGSLPEDLGRLSELRELDLGGNRFSGPIPPELWGLGRLQSLRLEWNQLSGEIPPELGQLSELRELDLGGNRFSGPIPPQLGGLGRLQSLHLGSNQLSGEIPPQLGGLGRLRSLRLGSNQLTGEIPPELGQLSELRVLSLSDNQFTGRIPTQLGALGHLLVLNLSGNQVTGPIPSVLGRLANLRHLQFFGNHLSGTIPATLGNLEELTVLGFGDNDLSGPLPVELGNADKLEDLDLRGNALTGPVPPEFGNLTLMKSLILADNPGLAGALPPGITALGQLERFMAGGTGLCRPADSRFDAWFHGIPDRRLVRCEGGAVYLTQAVQSWDDPVPLVAGEPALLRVFVTTRQGSATMPDVRATFYLDGAKRHTVHIPASTQTVPSEVIEDDLAVSANAKIPDWVIVPGLEMVVEVDPEGTLDPALGVRKRIPEAGRIDVDVRALPPLHLTLVPLLDESEPDSSIVDSVRAMAADPDGHELLADVRTLLPIPELAVTAHEPVTTSFQDPFRLIGEIAAMRIMEGGSGYWMGVMQPPPRTGGTSFYYLLPIGVAYTGGTASVSIREPSVMAHELGHNLALQHAPCGNPRGSDPWFPYSGGNTGAWGYNFAENALVTPQTPDLMSYCTRGGYWISDFFFNKALNHRMQAALSTGLASLVAAPTKSLLLWGGVDTEGTPFLEPAFIVDAPASLPRSTGEYQIIGRTADGDLLFSLSFEMLEVADGDGRSSFVFALPVQPEWGDELASITLTGPGGSVTLDQDTDRPVTILRNPQTGQIRGILRGSEATPQKIDDAVSALASGTVLEKLTSRGIPDPEDWTQ